ncbi:BPSL0067 family protein [Massilia agilis]|uniref:BPSL0067 family protein n=1 Tax=Massilia agilis TaxID=1811226 RepID=A0ABT2DA69_9BURK|nr:BPSL0067 family protein [Massilia agilis]MCS0808052.1 BPSL0067 family protein [Massilia agilis]
MSYVAINPRKFEDTSVGSGQCVAFVQAATQVGPTRNWTRGKLVMGANLPVGTAIATFDEQGRYANDTHGRSHAAIYLGQTAVGIRVLDQWSHRKKQPDGTVKVVPHMVQERTIYFQPQSLKEVDDGRKYYVIE